MPQQHQTGNGTSFRIRHYFGHIACKPRPQTIGSGTFQAAVFLLRWLVADIKNLPEPFVGQVKNRFEKIARRIVDEQFPEVIEAQFQHSVDGYFGASA